MIKQLAHICIHTADLEATCRFYQEGLGLQSGMDFIKDGALFGCYFKLGNDTFIEVFKGGPGDPGNINHVAIQVSDMDAVIARLRQHGYEVGDKTMGADHAWQAWTADPNGVRIEFHEYTPESLQLTGGTCVVDW
jgi:catechol 2,3-dioxygenase-like lactoylglutathione lyase family enzyme